MRANRRGFTLIELILVIAILGILAVSALPKFYDLTYDAFEAEFFGTVGALNSGILIAKAECLVNGTLTGPSGPLDVCGDESYPTLLDDVGVASCSGDTCFEYILDQPIDSAAWQCQQHMDGINIVYAKIDPNDTGHRCVFGYKLDPSEPTPPVAGVVEGPRSYGYCLYSAGK